MLLLRLARSEVSRSRSLRKHEPHDGDWHAALAQLGPACARCDAARPSMAWRLPLAWRAHLAAAAIGSVDAETRASAEALGFAVVRLPETPGEAAAARARSNCLERPHDRDVCARAISSSRAGGNGWPCRRPTTRRFACGRCRAPRPTCRSSIRRSNASRCGRRGSRCRQSDEIATQDGARLLSEALRLSLRRGAGPFRSAARLGFEPRAYQLVPLLMALRLPVVRLLIADDVGIGKTIEAGLILRELIDRGEVDRFAVLCPPHLVEQWTDELKAKFDLDAVAVTAASARGSSAACPPSQTLFDAHPYTVVSLDYIKAERRRDSFARACPALVVVDEAHACVGTHQSRQQRFELLKRLAEDAERHLILLTATPHSGDEAAFDRLLSLLDPGLRRRRARRASGIRVRLARHFVQRRRSTSSSRDWGEERVFPRHETAERPYELEQRPPVHSTMPCSTTASASSRAPAPTSAAGGWRSGARWR